MQSEHWDVTSTVIRRWWPPLHDRDRVPEADLIAAEQRLNLRLPQALRDWYLRAGRRLDFMGNADHFLPPEHLYICDNLLCIGSENQGCFRWWIPLRYCYLNDPPVTIDEALPQESLFLQNNAYRVPKHDEVAHRRSFTEFIRDMIISMRRSCMGNSEHGAMFPEAPFDALPKPMSHLSSRVIQPSTDYGMRIP